jgi:glutamine synthetase
VRIHKVAKPNGRRIEVLFPEHNCNPNLAFSAILL